MLNIKQAVILAGGRGKRLLPHSEFLNKGMVPVLGKPFLHYLVEQFAGQGIKKILFLTGHLAETIQDYFGDGSKFGLEIGYNFQPADINHGKRIELAFSEIDNFFILHKCDILWPFNIKVHLNKYQKLNRPIMMTVYNNNKRDGIYGCQSNIEMNEGIVKSYNELSDESRYIGQDLGYIICDKNVLASNFPSGNFSLHDGGLLGVMAANNLLSGFLTEYPATTITDSNWLMMAEKYIKDHNTFNEKLF
jgi:NDP-sugar pyrophosphorylase family protein